MNKRNSIVLALEERIGYHFSNAGLLKTALTHSSAAGERNTVSNQRLEFLGDAVLQLCVSHILYETFDKYAEGALSKIRSQIVCADSLFETGKKIGLDKAIFLGKGEEQSGGRSKKNIIADAMESLIAAIYLDGGQDASDRFIKTYHYEIIEEAINGQLIYDFKTMLQEYVQANDMGELLYELLNIEGPDHDHTFTTRVVIGGVVYPQASAANKKQSEHHAAENALKALGRI
ncbi:MAG: ribonuclease III [Eubacteriaceae bacterium]|nr:ribonuclease III [Eubacteriaceae bacterium]